MVDESDPMERFEAWLLRRVAHAVEAGEVSSDLLTELRDEFEAVRETPPEMGMAEAVRTFAEITPGSPRSGQRCCSPLWRLNPR